MKTEEFAVQAVCFPTMFDLTEEVFKRPAIDLTAHDMAVPLHLLGGGGGDSGGDGSDGEDGDGESDGAA